jgi:hypothetical protein
MGRTTKTQSADERKRRIDVRMIERDQAHSRGPIPRPKYEVPITELLDHPDVTDPPQAHADYVPGSANASR